LDVAETVEKGHGRRERRRLQASTRLSAHSDWPGLEQVCRLTRTVTKDGKTTTEIAYAITSVPRDQADAEKLLTWWRGHWGIENRLHWVRDETFGEDRCRIRTGSGPQVLAALRNGAISLMRHLGWNNLAAGLRHYTFHPNELFTTLGIVN